MVLKRAQEAVGLPWAPPIVALQQLIETNPTIYMLFNEMLTEVPTKPPFNKDPSGRYEIRTVADLLLALNYQIQSPIRYDDSPQIGTPINALLCWPMATNAGFAAFLRDDVNLIFQQMLQLWGKFLKNDVKSVKYVTSVGDGWLSTTAQSQKHGLANFLQTYIVPDPNDLIHYGFTSWDQFFTRKFQPGLRPLPSPPNESVIVSAAESTPFYIQSDVQLHDTFWVKNPDGRSNYSLAEMLGDVGLAKKFVGGTVYQAFLSADSYHNWHAPVDGTYVQDPKIIPGTYYSEPLMWGFDQDGNPVPQKPDSGADALSQGYISSVAVRGVAVIQADNPAIGLMAIITIGMAEVSSIEFDYPKNNPNPKFSKGDEIGRFHFGGSTHCLIFGRHVNLAWKQQAIPSTDVTKPGNSVPVKSAIATVLS
jgi:phosphatidylserine decarboxylase